MKEIEYYEITENKDKTEGRGPSVGTGIAFTSKEEAVKFASSDEYKQFAVMGAVNAQYAHHNVRQGSLLVFDTLKEYQETYPGIEKARLRESALKKLTKEEREALGL